MLTTRAWPQSIRFRLVDSDEFLRDFALRDHWHPFEAACLIRRCKPGDVTDDPAVVGMALPHAISNDDIDVLGDGRDPEAEKDLINLTRSIVQKWGVGPAPAAEIVEWGLAKGLLWDAPFVRRVLGRTPEHAHSAEVERLNAEIDQLRVDLARLTETRGKHAEEKRIAILGFALRELVLCNAADHIAKLAIRTRINASGLADHLETVRDELKMPDESVSGFSHRAIEKVISDASTAASKYVTDKSLITPD